ncbi:MAG TPA: PLP-dependent aminotransferase family protein [Candidatus Sulfotelmatobacter sp.]|nr:PLP-dependent aminotransferase family protein [Candidatus Sulfotelmatobacter sp.]
MVQFVARQGIIDLGWGHPDPELLPANLLRAAAVRVIERYGPDAFNYGYAAGPGPLISWVCERLRSTDLRAPTADCVVATAGNSHALDQVATLFTNPGDVVLVESPTYHLAVRILADHPVELVPVPADSEGLRVDALADLLARLRSRKRTVRLLYTVPTYHNPMGVSLANERRSQLVALAADERIVIVEDDAYRELSYDGDAPPSLWSLAPPGVVLRLGSFAKSLAPGLRAGFITSDQPTINRIRNSGVLDSGGGISHFSSLVVAEFANSGDYARNVSRLREAYRERRDALITALAEHLENRASWLRPAGGYFVWLTFPPGHDTTAILSAAEAEGMSFMPGASFSLKSVDSRQSLRLAFSRYPPDALAEAARRLKRALVGATGAE